jgi:hypothetical protein
MNVLTLILIFLLVSLCFFYSTLHANILGPRNEGRVTREHELDM